MKENGDKIKKIKNVENEKLKIIQEILKKKLKSKMKKIKN
jgi:hypothetical protein